MGDITYTFSSIEKGEYSKLYDYLKSKKVKVTASGKSDGGKLSWEDNVTEKGIDHHLEKVKQDAEIFSSGSDDMSSDDTDFNPDELEALSAREEYDSEPTTTSSEDESDDYGSGSDAERKREEKRKQKAEKKTKKDYPGLSMTDMTKKAGELWRDLQDKTEWNS